MTKSGKSDRRKLFLQHCGNTTTGCGLGAGDRRRSRHAQRNIQKIFIKIELSEINTTLIAPKNIVE